MLISQNELKKHGIDLSIKELEDKLIQLGHEVEGVTSYKNDKLVVGLIVAVQAHENSDHLNVCQVDIGHGEVVQIVCGAPNVEQGQFVIVALVGCILPGDFKIKKSKIRGESSFGMICAISELGLDENLLIKEDSANIYVFSTPQTPGDNALELINLFDNVLDLSLTANRGDCLSYVGIVRDLRGLLDIKKEIGDFDIITDKHASITVVNNDDKTAFLSVMEINNIFVKDSSIKMRIFLAKHGIKSQNNIVDIANYVMLQTGVPVHTYDAKKISGNLEVDTLSHQEEFIGLDEKTYNLQPGNLVVKDTDKTISIACVLGSNETKVTSETVDIILEIGVFDPIKVRKSANILGNKTAASIRGEKNIDQMACFSAYELFISLIRQENNDVIIHDIVLSNELEIHSNLIKLDVNEVFLVLGIKLEISEIKKILDNLHFDLIEENENILTYLVPSWRFDIFNDHDLIEEVVRVYSMENISVQDVLVNFNLKNKIINNKKVNIERDLEQVVLNLGLNQVTTYSLISEDELLMGNGDITKAIKLMMPLSNLRSYYRQSMISSLLDVAKYNFDRQAKQVNIFEIGNIYTLVNKEVIEEYKIAGILGGIKEDFYTNKVTNYDFYDAKGVVEEILDNYKIKYSIIPTSNISKQINPFVHADVVVDNKVIGFIGLKHVNYYKKIKQQVFMFELNLSMIEDKLIRKITYEKVSTNPSVTRDLTFLCPKNQNYLELIEIFHKIKYLDTYQIKDIYIGENIIDGMQAITFSMVFTANEVTLTGVLVDESVEKIIKQAIEKGYEFNKE